jgi:hypothetical protein
MYKPAEKLLIGMYVEEIMPCKLTVHFWAPNDVFFSLCDVFFSIYGFKKQLNGEDELCNNCKNTYIDGGNPEAVAILSQSYDIELQRQRCKNLQCK